MAKASGVADGVRAEGATGPLQALRAVRRVPAGSRQPGGAPLKATSPIALASHLMGLAGDAERTGLTGLAEQLLALAHAVLDHQPAMFV